MREISEKGGDAPSVKFLYETKAGGLVLRLITRRWLSRLVGAYLDGRLSKCMIKGYVKRHQIRTEDFISEKYRSFNAFFTRKIRSELRPFDLSPAALCSPCDGKLTVLPVTERGEFQVKGFTYTAESLLRNEPLARKFYGGLCLIFRLTVSDYHRYHYFDGGYRENGVFIKGRLHTVQPTALEKRRVFTENCREYTVLHTENFGEAVQTEVGALMVGRIVNDSPQTFSRGDEKGRFEFGGSTVILLLSKGAAVIEEEILENSRLGYETTVKCGERIGSAVVR